MAHNISAALAPHVVPLQALHEDPKNVRRHDARNISAIQASLRDLGQQKPIVVDGTGKIIAGNGTYRAAVALGWGHIAAVVFQGDAQAARKFAIADNRTAELATWDVLGLQGELHDLGEPAWETAGWTADELRDTTGSLPSAGTATPDAPGADTSVDIDGKAAKGLTPEDKLETFMNGALRQVVLIYKAEDHARVVAALERVCQEQGLKNSTEAVDWLLKAYDDARDPVDLGPPPGPVGDGE